MPSLTLEVPNAGDDIDAGLHATNYNDIQTLLNGGLDGSNFVNASLTLGSSFALNIGGDTNLYRGSANVLQTDDNIRTNRSATTDASLASLVTGQNNSHWVMFADGKMEWGGGVNPRDTNLYRSAADMLKTDDHLTVAGTPASDGDTPLIVNINLSSAISARRVVIGAADSGGSGFRMLRVVN